MINIFIVYAMTGTTLYDKIWSQHKIQTNNEDSLIYIDRQLIHEVTSPQAFEGIELAGRKVKNPSFNLAVADHNVPTDGHWRQGGIKDKESRDQVAALEENCKKHGIKVFSLGDVNQGIVHVVGPELGFTQPGMTIVCGDSHTSTHGAFGALAFGIGTSEVEHVLATQTLRQKKSKNMLVKVNGKMQNGVRAKDIIMAIIGKLGTAGGTGYVIEYAGEAIEALSIEQRMTICNMTIEAGARAGLIAPDEKTFEYLRGKELSPKGKAFDDALAYWKTLKTDSDAIFDATIELDANTLEPQITWGTSPEDVCGISGSIPFASSYANEGRRESFKRSIAYMGIEEGQKITDISIDKVFIGSCTNARIEDFRDAAALADKFVKAGKKIAPNIKLAMVVPGSGLVKIQAEQEGLDKIFIAAGFEWREPGCSMCLAMNNDRLSDGERCVSTSNRNFEGRQGRGGRTHLASPITAVASAFAGKIASPSSLV
jgi:3-isopropylmalate/(R)-2-methylmalate dehydratase large subunit